MFFEIWWIFISAIVNSYQKVFIDVPSVTKFRERLKENLLVLHSDKIANLKPIKTGYNLARTLAALQCLCLAFAFDLISWNSDRKFWNKKYILRNKEQGSQFMDFLVAGQCHIQCSMVNCVARAVEINKEKSLFKRGWWPKNFKNV